MNELVSYGMIEREIYEAEQKLLRLRNQLSKMYEQQKKDIRKHEREKTIKEVIGKVSKVIENSCTCDYDELGNLNDRCLLHMEFRGLIKELKED